jgi:transcriptional regulator with PAS, ATPase and Fis domain
MIIRQEGWVHKLLLSLADKLSTAEKEKTMLQTALDNAYEGIVIANAEGMVIMANEAYARFLGTTIAGLVGRHASEVIENTRMHVVARTGVAEIAQMQKINGHNMIANRIPVFNGGKLAAVIGTVIFQEVDDLFALTSRFEKLKKELEFYKGEWNKKLHAKYSFDTILGTSPEIEEVTRLARRVAKNDTTILIKGESGTGKELFAHAIHRESSRFSGPLIKVNCAAIPETLFESELFGYKEGSFTGAKKSGKKGKFAAAQNGTLFLDEISEMPLMMQAKLLRVLQEKEIEPIGSEAPESIDVRIIAATNKNLQTLVDEGKFRNDLYYRLNVVMLEVPALRDRQADIALLTCHFLRQLEKETGIPVEGVDLEAEKLLHAYPWPGNIRELRNVLERALYVKNGTTITRQDLPHSMFEYQQAEKYDAEHHLTLKYAIEQLEDELIRRAIKETKGSKIAAAARLGISKSSLYEKIAKYEISE